MKKWMERNLPRRGLAMALCLCMVLSLLPVSAFAAEGEGICQHHPEHTELCGYVAAVEGQECQHQHDDACGYQEAHACGHSHDGSCGYVQAAPCGHEHTEQCGENGEQCTHSHDASCGFAEARDCTHVCGESCGYREAHTCGHVHDDSCGYVEAVAGQPCGFVCEICAQQENQPPQQTPELCPHGNDPDACEVCACEARVASVQALIDALPEDVTAETKEAVQAALADVDTAVANLTEAEQTMLDLTRYTDLQQKLAALELATPEPTEAEPAPEEAAQKRITAWEWIDEEEFLDEETGNLALPGASAETPAYFEDVVCFLPYEITAMVEGSEEILPIDWVCEDYPEAGAYEGEYTFAAILPEGYVLDEGVSSLVVSVLLGGAQQYAVVTGIPYLEWSTGSFRLERKTLTQNATLLGSGSTTWSKGWYVADGEITIGSRVEVTGVVDLILKDGCKLTINGGIHVPSSGNLTIYAQSEGSAMGKLIAKSTANGQPGIGGNQGEETGNITINCGNITATGNEYGAGIGSGRKWDAQTRSKCGWIWIHGGIVNATGGSNAAGIGNGYDGAGGTVLINGGTVVAKNGTNAACIGDTWTASTDEGGCKIYIYGGTVIADATENGTGIGYYNKNYENVTFPNTFNCSAQTTNGITITPVVIASGSNHAISELNSLNADGLIFQGARGTLYGIDSCTLYQDLTIPAISGGRTLDVEAGKTLTIASGTTLTIPSNVTLTVNGTLINNGKLVIKSGGKLNISGKMTVASGGSLTLNGSLTNTGSLVFESGAAVSGSGTYTGSDSSPSLVGAVVLEGKYLHIHVLNDGRCSCGYSLYTYVTVSGITAKNKTYDGSKTATLDCTKATLTGVASGDTVSVTATGTFADAGVGTGKKVTISGLTLTGADVSKYRLATSGQQASTTASITAKDITVSITPNGGTYSGTITPASAKFTGVVGNDNVGATLTYTGTAIDGTNYSSTTPPSKAGSYTVTVSISNKNYNLTGTKTASFVVNKATVTTPETLGSKTYSGVSQLPTIAASALYKLPADAGYKDADTYSLTLELKDSANYQWDKNGGRTSFQITPKALTVKAENKTVTYGDPVPSYTASYTGFVNGETAQSLGFEPTYACDYSAGSPVNASGYPIKVSGSLQNYKISFEPGILTVQPKTLNDANITLTVADKDLVYTGAALTPDVSVKWGDKTLTKDTDFTVSYKSNVNAGSAAQTTITGAGNYTGEKSASFTIQPRNISGVTIEVSREGNWVYNGSRLEPNVTVTNGDYTITKADYSVSYENNVNAGENTAAVVLTGKNNYTGTASKFFSIAKAPSDVYPHPVPVKGLTYSGQPQTLVTPGRTTHGTLVYSLTWGGTYTSVPPTGTNAGTYTIWYKVLGDDNHLDSNPASVNCTIGKASLTVTANDHTITYGDEPANDGVSFDGFVYEETEAVLGGTLTYEYSYDQYDDVGSNYTIIPGGLTSDNYDITFEDGKLTVEQKEIGITWGNTELTYNGKAQMPTADPTGTVNNDAITFAVSGAKTNAGSGYTAKIDSIQGDKSGNYALPENVTTTFSIAQKEVTIENAAVEPTKVYDSKTTAQITSEGTLSANFDGANLTIVPGTAAYDNKNVGEGKEVTFSGFSLGGSAAGNYTLTAQPASVKADITAKPVTITVTVKDKSFDGTTDAEIEEAILNDIEKGDEVTLVNGTPTFAYANVGEDISISFTDFSLEGTDAGNYDLA